MSSSIIYLLAIVCVCSTSGHRRPSQYNNENKNKATQVCVKEGEMKQFVMDWCKQEEKYDVSIIKNYYTEDATFVYLKNPPLSVQNHLEMMVAFKKEFNSYFNINNCHDYAGNHKFLGCEHQTVPSVLKGFTKITAKDKPKTTFKGPYSIEFAYVDGKVKISKVTSQIPIDEKIINQIISKITSNSETTAAPEVSTKSDEQDDDYEVEVPTSTESAEEEVETPATEASETTEADVEQEDEESEEPEEVDEVQVN